VRTLAHQGGLLQQYIKSNKSRHKRKHLKQQKGSISHLHGRLQGGMKKEQEVGLTHWVGA
jgi:hypothetical protein